MPETVKLDAALEEESSATQGTRAGDNRDPAHSGMPLSSGSPEPAPSSETAEKIAAGDWDPEPAPHEGTAARAALQPEEEPSEDFEAAPSQDHEEAAIREFAESVMSSLEEAGFEVEESEAHLSASPEDLLDDHTGFFAGWNGLAEEREQTSEALEPEDREERREKRQKESEPDLFDALLKDGRSLSELSLASVGLEAEEAPADADGDLSSKHDELADAVQLALANIYGDGPAAADPAPSSPVYSSEWSAPGPGWETPQAVGATDDGLTPQDVILNYFSYNTDTKGAQQGEAGAFRAAAFNQERPKDEGFYAAAGAEPHWPNSLTRHGAYEGPPSFPVPAGLSPAAKSDAASEKESSRVLGAAAIGLVGGIAIAASLAVFVINSYGPGVHGGLNRTLNSADQGYGRRSCGAGEGETPAAPRAEQVVQPAAEEQPVIAAADVFATPGQPSALAIVVKSEPSNDQALVSITGVPEGARLSAGVDAGQGNWLLPPRRLNGLTINLPSGAPEKVQLSVQLLDSNFRTPLSESRRFAVRVATPRFEAAAAPTKPEATSLVALSAANATESAAFPEQPKAPPPGAAPFFNTQTVSTPAVAAPEQAQVSDVAFKPVLQAPPPAPTAASQRQAALVGPAGAPRNASQSEIEDLIREGNKRMREGDILEARQLYQKAVSLGDPEAALAMGRSYDPIYFARIDRKNAEPDAAKAFDWYRKAMDGGAAQTAKVRIDNLKHFLNE